MKTRFKFLTYGLFALAVTITSCETEELQGPIGPVGPMGEQGIAGPEGPTGEDGEALGVPGPEGTPGETGETGATGATGATGPAGETGSAGPAGEAGPAGANGSNGTNGEDGNADIMYSDWLNQDLTHQNFVKFKQMQVIEPKLTNAFLNNGGFVLGFFRFTTSAIHNLPYTHVTQKTMRELLISPTSGGRILFTLHSTDDTNLDNEDIEGINPAFNPQYKYVLVAGGTSLSGKSQQDFKKMTYYEIMDYLELEY